MRYRQRVDQLLGLLTLGVLALLMLGPITLFIVGFLLIVFGFVPVAFIAFYTIRAVALDVWHRVVPR